MRKLSLGLGALVTLLAIPLFAGSAKAQVQIFGGYSYARPSLTFVESPQLCPVALPSCPPPSVATAHPNLNGWEVTGVYNAYHWLGIAGDFGGNYGSVNGASAHLNTYLFGPQVQLHGPVSPFAQALIGAAHETVGGATNNGLFITPVSSYAFAAEVGAGIDVSLAPFVSLRAIQLDYLVTRFGSSTQLRQVWYFISDLQVFPLQVAFSRQREY